MTKLNKGNFKFPFHINFSKKIHEQASQNVLRIFFDYINVTGYLSQTFHSLTNIPRKDMSNRVIFYVLYKALTMKCLPNTLQAYLLILFTINLQNKMTRGPRRKCACTVRSQQRAHFYMLHPWWGGRGASYRTEVQTTRSGVEVSFNQGIPPEPAPANTKYGSRSPHHFVRSNLNRAEMCLSTRVPVFQKLIEM